MTLRVYNTLTRKKEEFIPLEEGKVKMYVCGVTPYNQPHIGNARPFITWDVIHRYFEKLGYKVTHIQNFTDVDDKIINAANREGVSWDAIAGRYIQAYFEVMDQLNIRRVDVYPRVSDHMKEIIDMVSGLVEKGFAYEIDGDVYYGVQNFPVYGKLSGRDLEDMQAGARVDVDDRKRHPMDFALWKSAKPGEPAWDSPWGPGRPGWHIECSAMSLKYLGSSFDFHGGGSDLIFPHHENEIAQSVAYTGQEDFVHYWLHNGFITVNEEKMSKSLGNFFLVNDILAHYRPETLRYFIIATHYRSPLDFSDERLTEAEKSLDRLRTANENLTYLAKLPAGIQESEEADKLCLAGKQAKIDFYDAMDDDFNTALAVSVLFGLAKEINTYHSGIAAGKFSHNYDAIQLVQGIFAELLDILGLQLTQPEAAAEDGAIVDQLMDIIIGIRQDARQTKNWTVADRIRDSLTEVGIQLEDTPLGVRWKRK